MTSDCDYFSGWLELQWNDKIRPSLAFPECLSDLHLQTQYADFTFNVFDIVSCGGAYLGPLEFCIGWCLVREG